MDEYDVNHAHEVVIMLDADECVSARFRRDYCPACLDPRWRAICEIIGAGSEDYSGSDFY